MTKCRNCKRLDGRRKKNSARRKRKRKTLIQDIEEQERGGADSGQETKRRRKTIESNGSGVLFICRSLVIDVIRLRNNIILPMDHVKRSPTHYEHNRTGSLNLTAAIKMCLKPNSNIIRTAWSLL